MVGSCGWLAGQLGEEVIEVDAAEGDELAEGGNGKYAGQGLAREAPRGSPTLRGGPVVRVGKAAEEVSLGLCNELSGVRRREGVEMPERHLEAVRLIRRPEFGVGGANLGA